ncbi:MAG: class I SAM-dependent methyltransferase family protein [Desulfurococcales archaeon]|nr:class I SAM-dependent methyltransferase family protein [Desulfurococcales archaeon]
MKRCSIIRRIAKEVAGEELAARIWKRIDIVGDIAVIKAPPYVSLNVLRNIASRLIEQLPYIKSVWLASSPVEGPYRVRESLTHLAGERRTETIYKEHGCRFKVDIAKVFITPRLNYEHARIAKLVGEGEVIVNMFAGAGLFSIIIACKARPKKVYSIDINPHAYRLMVENVALNKVNAIVEPILGDAAKVIEESLSNTADRVLMPLPELALDYLPYALKALSNGRGWLHVYLHIKYAKGENPLEIARAQLSARLDELGVDTYRFNLARRVRKVGPRTDQVVLDVLVG